MRPLSIFLFPFRVLLTVIFAPFVIIIHFLLVICIFLPSLLIRKLVEFIGGLVDRDLCKLVGVIGSVPGRDFPEWTTNPSQSINIVLKLKGHCSLDIIQKIVLQKVVLRTSSKGGELEYPELQQYCTKRLGYLFFKWNRQFKIEDHVQVYQSKTLLPHPGKDVVDEEKLVEIWEDLDGRPYLPKKSPWQVICVPNYKPNNAESDEDYTIIILRFQHALADGISIHRFLLVLTDNGLETWETQIGSIQPPKCFNFFLHLKGILFGPTSFLWNSLKGFDLRNPIHIPQRRKAGRPFITTASLSVKKVKKICEIHGVSFHSVTIAALTGGIREYFLKNRFTIPYSPIKLGMPIPLPGHSEKLRNQFLCTCIDLPVHKTTAKARILACDKIIKGIKNSALMPLFSQSVMLIGGMPLAVARFLTMKSGNSVMFSMIKGPPELLSVNNGEFILEDVFYNCSLGFDEMGVGYCSTSYNGKLHIILTVDRGIAKSRPQAQQLLDCIEKEFDHLIYGDSSNL